MKKVLLLLLLTFFSMSLMAKIQKIALVRWDITQNYKLGAIGIRQYFSEKGITFPEKQLSFMGNKANKDNIIAQLKEYNPDMIITLGTSCTKIIKANFPNIPIVYAVVYDAKKAGLIESMKSSGNNLVGVNTKLPWIKKLKMIKDIFPNATKIGTLYNENELNSKISLNDMKNDAQKLKNLEIISYMNDKKKPEEVLEAVKYFDDKNIDIFLANNDNYTTHTDNIKMIVKHFDEKGIPVFGKNRENVEDGCLIAISGDYIYNGYQAAQLAEKIINGKKPSELSSAYTGKTKIFVNIKKMKKLKIKIPLKYMKIAKKIR